MDVLAKNLSMLSKQDVLEDAGNSMEIVICDNNQGAQIDEVKKLAKKIKIKNIHFINSKNLGFGAGHNQVFAFAEKNLKFDYFLIVNPDGIPHPRMISYLTDFAKKNNDKGIFEALQFPVEHPKIYDVKTQETAWCSGCCALFPRHIFEILKGFDERFFMYMEDVDISWRARAGGLKCYVVEDALFSHSISNKDRDFRKQNIAMHKSAYKLAIKYHNQKFAIKILERLQDLDAKNEINLLESEAHKMIIKDFSKYKNIVDFKNKFYFSEARW